MDNLTKQIGEIVLIVTLLTIIFTAYNFLKIKIQNYLFKRKESNEKKTRLNSFYSKIHNSYKDLKPFLDSLDKMILEVTNQNIPQSELNKILTGYHFYQDVIEKIFSGNGVEEDDLIYFAEMHVSYTNLVKDWKNLKNKEFYSKHHFFDIHLN